MGQTSQMSDPAFDQAAPLVQQHWARVMLAGLGSKHKPLSKARKQLPCRRSER